MCYLHYIEISFCNSRLGFTFNTTPILDEIRKNMQNDKKFIVTFYKTLRHFAAFR